MSFEYITEKNITKKLSDSDLDNRIYSRSYGHGKKQDYRTHNGRIGKYGKESRIG